MQTFLPYPSYLRSVKVLDYRRLGKQRVECLQILNALKSPTNGWRNHPAVLMWRGYENSLTFYMKTVILEWIYRGYKNNMIVPKIDSNNLVHPKWLGLDEFHASHRSNLLRKNPKYYSKFGWIEPDNLGYFWPTKHGY